MNREEEYKTFLSGQPGGYARIAYSNKRRTADKNIIRVLKRIINQKQPRFYEPPAIRREESDIEEGFAGFSKWVKEGKPTKVWFEYPEDILEWIHREKGMRTPVFDYTPQKWLSARNKNVW